MRVDLNFTMQEQGPSNWCWSAVSVSTDGYYNPPTQWTQCRLANDLLGQTGCCANGHSTACDQQFYLEVALGHVGHRGAVFENPPSDAALFAELDAGRPVGVRIEWNGFGTGHFVMVTGYDNDDPANVMVDIDDPADGEHVRIARNQFPSSYRTVGGVWTHTYLTV